MLILIADRKRFENFVDAYRFVDERVQKHKKRYEILDLFFTEYNNQISNYHFGNQSLSGYCGVVELVNDITRGKITFKYLCAGPLKELSDSVIRWYIEGLISELPSILKIN